MLKGFYMLFDRECFRWLIRIETTKKGYSILETN